MTEPPILGGIDPERRRREIIEMLATLGVDAAQKQIEVLPYYESIENAITQSKAGIWVTTYFLTKWKPDLGHPAADIVLALQKCADKNTGDTIASLSTIAKIAGVSRSCLALWISTNPKLWENKSAEQRRQWDMLHRYWIKEKANRHRQHFDELSGKSQTRQTTSRIRITLDDPVHPSDIPKLYALAAERMIQEEAAEQANALKTKGKPYESTSKTHKDLKETVRLGRPDLGGDNSPYESTAWTHTSVHQVDSRSYSDRSNADVSNVGVTSRTESESDRVRSAFAQDPRVSKITREEREKNEALVLELGDWLHRKHGYRETDAHKSAGAHRRAVYFGGPNLVREAMRILDDRIEAGTAGRKDWIRDPSAAFWGVVRNLAADKGISLDPGGEVPAERKFEAVAGSGEATAAVLEPSRRSVGGAARTDEPTEDRTPEARARVYADHLFPFQFRIEHDRDPSADEIEAEYEKRLTLYRGQASTERAPSRRP